MNYWKIKPSEIFYLNRLKGTGSYHNSWLDSGPDGSAKVLTYVNTRLEQGEIPAGQIELHPAWQLDYVELVSDHIATLTDGE